MRRCVAGIPLYRLLEVLDSFVHVLGGPLQAEVTALEEKLVSLPIDRAGTCQPRFLLRRQRNLDLSGDCVRHLALQGEDVAQVALVAVGPQVPVRGRMDQLRRDPHPLPGAQNRPLHHRIYVQLARDLRHLRPRVLVLHRRGP